MLRNQYPLKERRRGANSWRRLVLLLVITLSVFTIPPACPYSHPVLPYGAMNAVTASNPGDPISLFEM